MGKVSLKEKLRKCTLTLVNVYSFDDFKKISKYSINLNDYLTNTNILVMYLKIL